MKLLLKALIFCTLMSVATVSAMAGEKNRFVEIQTNRGNIVIELNAEKAPGSVKNFLTYVLAASYDETIFHRVINGFMIQGGGFDVSFRKRSTLAPIKNEADNGLKNKRGTIAMARTGDPHSATAQFFINLNDNTPLDFRSRNQNGWGYAVFGKVTSGMDVVDSIAQVRTASRGGHGDVPVEPVVIERVFVRK